MNGKAPAPADHETAAELWRGLRELAETTFPKRCPNCGRVYHDAREFVVATQGLGQNGGFKSTHDDDGRPILELYRNCICGSTLLGCFDERRDNSEAGQKRRRRFGQLLATLVDQGLDRSVARAELLKLMHGGQSTILAPLVRPPSPAGDTKA